MHTETEIYYTTSRSTSIAIDTGDLIPYRLLPCGFTLCKALSFSKSTSLADIDSLLKPPYGLTTADPRFGGEGGDFLMPDQPVNPRYQGEESTDSMTRPATRRKPPLMFSIHLMYSPIASGVIPKNKKKIRDNIGQSHVVAT
jgi:hypothetical protein